jgi:hypothetical protein
MLFRKNLIVCSKPLTFEKDRAQEIDQNLLICLRREGAVVPEVRASFRWYVRFCSGSSLNVLFRKTATEMVRPRGVMRQTILSGESELKQIDNAIAVAKSPWIFPSRRNPGRHVSRGKQRA